MFQNMKYVYEIYKEQSFSKAAQNLFISQPSLSATIKRIETEMGVPIFDRSTNPIVLTEAGVHYIRVIEEIMEIKNDFQNYLSDIQELKIGHLIVGGSSLFSSYVLPRLISYFTKCYPQITIELVEASTIQLEQMLQSSRIDLFIDNCDNTNPLLDRKLFQPENILLAVPKDSLINCGLKKYQLSMDSIKNRTYLKHTVLPVPFEIFNKEAFIMLKKENDTRQRGIAICKEYGFYPNIRLELDQQATSYNVTCSGLGISFISDTLVSCVPPHPNVVYYKLQGSEISRNIYFYWKAKRYKSKAMEAFLESVDNYQENKME